MPQCYTRFLRHTNLTSQLYTFTHQKHLLTRPSSTSTTGASSSGTHHHHHHPAEDFGTYSVILPEEPFVFGVSHITPRRSVPRNITYPGYAKPPGSGTSANQHREGITVVERVVLGSDEEIRLREAGKLAKRVLEYAGGLVRVCSFYFSILILMIALMCIL